MYLRKCRLCGLKAHTEEDLTFFVKGRKGQHKYERCNLCKECDTLNAKAYYKNNKPRRKNYNTLNKASQKAYNQSHQRKHKEEYAARTGRRRAAKLQRTPKWLTPADFRYMESLYVSCAIISKLTGIEHHVDHTVPLQGKLVSGLHCPSNLQIITAAENLSKSNHF